MNYKAGWALDGETDPAYPDMDDEVSSIILLKAQALAQTKKNNAKAGTAYRYTIGGVTVDTTSQASALGKDVTALENEYEARVDKYIGHVFLMGDDAAQTIWRDDTWG
jgi:poly-gamma-glutamate capsule biosynthesis protein CapA/YwtB (metallophosphatase superfamily)